MGEYFSGRVGAKLHHLVLTLVDPQVRQVHEQFGPVPFRDADGQSREHYFDLMIMYRDGRRIGVAVKPEERLASGRVLSELRQLRATMPAGLVDEIRLVTERHYRRSSAFNATMYLRFKLTSEPEIDARLTEVISSTPGETSIADLIRRSRTGQGGFRAAVRAVFEGRLTKLSGGRIDLFTVVEAAI